MSNELNTFWQFLEEHFVRVPIIQRDYAQGRVGKEKLRKAFLTDLKKALDSNDRLKLDFVYGATEHGAVNPLDGQQRLTTLWLLHWYVAYMSGEINDNTSKIFKRSTYETRISSREFCERLSYFSKPLPDGKGIVAHIQNQTWFRSSWHHDPTIQSMLRMLGGSEHGALDGIEGVFNACHDGECVECRLNQCPLSQVKCDSYDEYWNRLTGNECPIVFHYLDIHGIGQTDDLYIKMNARGKPLTSFENFKADLAGYISRQASKGSNAKEIWEELNNPETGLAIKMDTDWMNGIFWKNKSSDRAVDEIYFAFINRFFFNAYILNMAKSDIMKGEDEVFDFLYGRNAKAESSDDQISYFGFDSAYARVLENEPKLLKRLADTLDNFLSFAARDEIIFQSPWGEEGNFRFVPGYESPGELHYDFAGNQIRKIGKIIQPHRVVFHAVCKFFEQGWRDGDDDALRNWMRVVWNIVENANINTIPSMIGCLKLVNELAEHSHNILAFLSNPDIKILSDFADEQVREERMKARKLIHDERWEEWILQAEKMVWLKGRIMVLFHDGDATSIERFKDRLTILEAVFKTAQTRTYYLQKILLSRYNAKLPEHVIDLSDNDANKKLLLTRFLSDCFRSIDKNVIVHNDNAWISDLTQSSLLENSRGKLVGSKDGVAVLWGTSGCRWVSFGNSVWGNVILGKRRNLIVTTPGIEMEDSSGIVPNTDFVCGRNVNFRYKEYWFQWWGVPNEAEYDVYLLRRDWRKHEDDPWMYHVEDASQTGDKRELYCFRVFSTDNCTSFAEKLDTLISELENAK